MTPTDILGNINLYNADCLEVMKGMPDNSVDSIVTDPPYELGFMGKSWDSTGIANNVDMWAECLRVLKPGGHLLAFSGTRTYHRMASAIEDAGFEIRDMVEWVYGSGFPKSLNVGKAVDKISEEQTTAGEYIIDKGTSEFKGWGTQLKPAHEPICMARKPLSEKSVAENCLKWGTGGINIDKSRVETDEEIEKGRKGRKAPQFSGTYNNGEIYEGHNAEDGISQGRFPANLIHDGSDEVVACFPYTKSGKAVIGTGKGYAKNPSGIASNGIIASCYADSGNASRFFKSIIYQAKASKSERGDRNNHPTVKPVALMEYLITMVTPKNGTVLEPFMGSGTTGVAAVSLNRNFIGIEMDDGYFEIAKARINEATTAKQLQLF